MSTQHAFTNSYKRIKRRHTHIHMADTSWHKRWNLIAMMSGLEPDQEEGFKEDLHTHTHMHTRAHT